jgi:hypothetical protein
MSPIGGAIARLFWPEYGQRQRSPFDRPEHDRPAAAEHIRDSPERFALFEVQPRGLGALAWLECMPTSDMLAASLGVRHAGDHPFADQRVLEFRDLAHDTAWCMDQPVAMESQLA